MFLFFKQALWGFESVSVMSQIWVICYPHHKLLQPVNDFPDLQSTHSTAFINISYREYVARETPFSHDELTAESGSNSA